MRQQPWWVSRGNTCDLWPKYVQPDRHRHTKQQTHPPLLLHTPPSGWKERQQIHQKGKEDKKDIFKIFHFFEVIFASASSIQFLVQRTRKQAVMQSILQRNLDQKKSGVGNTPLMAFNETGLSWQWPLASTAKICANKPCIYWPSISIIYSHSLYHSSKKFTWSKM